MSAVSHLPKAQRLAEFKQTAIGLLSVTGTTVFTSATLAYAGQCLGRDAYGEAATFAMLSLSGAFCTYGAYDTWRQKRKAAKSELTL